MLMTEKNRIDLDAVDYNSLPFDESEKIYNKIINKEIEEAKAKSNNDSGAQRFAEIYTHICLKKYFFTKYADEIKSIEKESILRAKKEHDKEESKEKVKNLRRTISETIFLAIVIGVLTDFILKLIGLLEKKNFTATIVITILVVLAYLVYYIAIAMYEFYENNIRTKED